MNDIKVFGGIHPTQKHLQGNVFVINERSVIDAGYLIGAMKEKCAAIETIWLTHSHLDHIVDIAFILDTYFTQRKAPLKVRALKETLEVLQKHFFNDQIWPDFTVIPLHNSNMMSLIYEPVELSKHYKIDECTMLEAYPTDHTVASCGYIVTKNERAVLISSYTYGLDDAIKCVQNDPNITSLVVECSFPDSLEQLAKTSKHLTPKLLFEKLRPLENKNLKLYINHIKPSYIETISYEIEVLKGKWHVNILQNGDTIHF